MSATLRVARDEMFALVQTFWDGEVTAPTTVLYPGVSGWRPSTPIEWARISVRHTTSFQSSLTNGVGQQRHTQLGLLTVELWYPQAQGMGDLDDFAQLVLNAIRGKKTLSGVWFRSVTPTEVGDEGPWDKMTVVAEFEYDQVLSASAAGNEMQTDREQSFQFETLSETDSYTVTIPVAMVDTSYVVVTRFSTIPVGGAAAMLVAEESGRTTTQFTLSCSGDLATGTIIDIIVRDRA